MMQHSYSSTQESGPDEDHQVQSPKFQKVLDEEDQSVCWNSGIFRVEKNCHLIEEFIDNIPMLVRHEGIYGLIWNKSLQPSDGRYEPGEHFCRTREPERKSTNGYVSFYRDGETGQKFAIKTLQDSDHFHSWEIKIGLVCSSPHLCAVYGVIIRNNKIHILLEHAGLELTKERSWIAESPERIRTFAKQSFRALEDLHGYGYVHCDIKPDNIMVVRDSGEDFTVKVIDFGSCQPKGEILPPDAHTTRFYWSPEVWQSLNDGDQVICQPAMDVYALALTLYFVQTACHLMNMLQERDILPLMTQRSEDLLLIALPETIPSGLRAVMRPCLAGKAEDRWSAKQAANQLDGDAMMQKALSNPRGENYKDLFQQLMKNQFEKHNLSPSENCACQTPNFSLSHLATSSPVKNEEPKTTENLSFVHYFVGSNKGGEKREMGFHMKSMGTKTVVEKKQSLRGKRVGNSNNSKWPKPRKIAMKGQGPLKHIKQLRVSGNETPNLSVQDNQEVHYISSDETTPGPSYKELTAGSNEKAVTGESHQSEVTKHVFQRISNREITQDDYCDEEMNRKQGQKEHSPVATEETCLKIDNMQQPVTPSDSDVKAFSCSALLITLASQARSSGENMPRRQLTLPAPSTHCSIGQMFERDKVSKKPASFYSSSDTKASCDKNCHSDFAHHQLHGKSHEKPVTLSEVQQSVESLHNKERAERENVVNTNEKANTPGTQISVSEQAMPIKPITVREENYDEMEFVFEALEIPQFTGQAEDILDNLCNMLDKDESKSVPATNIQKLNGGDPRGTFKVPQDNQRGDMEESMDVSDGNREKSKTGLSTDFPPHKEKSRKRISKDTENNLPSKARQLSSDGPTTEYLLPIFDEILPENIS